MINNKGFTLVELLVVLAISALILIMAIPSINNASSETRDKEYIEFKNSIVYGAKLYYRQRSSDLTWTGNTATISFADLKKAGLVKDFVPTQKSSKKGCNTLEHPENVSVIITKKDSKVSYDVSGLMCGIGNNTKEIK